MKMADAFKTPLKESFYDKVFKYKWELTKPDGSKNSGITTLVGPALQDVLDLHNVSNSDKLIEIWNNSAKVTSKTSGYIWAYSKA